MSGTRIDDLELRSRLSTVILRGETIFDRSRSSEESLPTAVHPDARAFGDAFGIAYSRLSGIEFKDLDRDVVRPDGSPTILIRIEGESEPPIDWQKKYLQALVHWANSKMADPIAARSIRDAGFRTISLVVVVYPERFAHAYSQACEQTWQGSVRGPWVGMVDSWSFGSQVRAIAKVGVERSFVGAGASEAVASALMEPLWSWLSDKYGLNLASNTKGPGEEKGEVVNVERTYGSTEIASENKIPCASQYYGPMYVEGDGDASGSPKPVRRRKREVFGRKFYEVFRDEVYQEGAGPRSPFGRFYGADRTDDMWVWGMRLGRNVSFLSYLDRAYGWEVEASSWLNEIRRWVGSSLVPPQRVRADAWSILHYGFAFLRATMRLDESDRDLMLEALDVIEACEGPAVEFDIMRRDLKAWVTP